MIFTLKTSNVQDSSGRFAKLSPSIMRFLQGRVLTSQSPLFPRAPTLGPVRRSIVQSAPVQPSAQRQTPGTNKKHKVFDK